MRRRNRCSIRYNINHTTYGEASDISNNIMEGKWMKVKDQLTNKSVGRKECGGDYLDELHCYLGAKVLFHFEMSSYY